MGVRKLRLAMAAFCDDDNATCEYWEPDDAKPVKGTNRVLWTHAAYAMHNCCWQVTHGPSGRSIAHEFITREDAEQFATELWSKLPDSAREIWKTNMTQRDARDCTPEEVIQLARRVEFANARRAEQDTSEETAALALFAVLGDGE